MKTPNKKLHIEQTYTLDSIDDIYESAFSSYGAKDADYSYVDYDVDNYAYEAY